jgi:hypothetical protein
MKVYGNTMMWGLYSQISRARLQINVDYPDNPRSGSIVFKDKKVYIYTEVATDTFVWLPLTSELQSWSGNFTNLSTWECVHGLDGSEVLIQCFDSDNLWIVPDDIDQSQIGITTLTFAGPMTGRVFVVQRLANCDRIDVFAKDENGNFIMDANGNYVLVG